MATLKGPLLYATETIPSELQLEFNIPAFGYTEISFTEPTRTIVEREIKDRHKKDLAIQGPRYTIELSDCEIYNGSDTGIRMRYLDLFSQRTDFMTRLNLEDLSFVIPVQIFHNKTSLGWQELEVIDLTVNTTNFFFVNKEAYDKLVDLLNVGIFSRAILLAIFSSVKMEGSAYSLPPDVFFPEIGKNLTQIYSKVAEGEQKKQYLDKIPVLIERLKEFDLNSLFEFPIAIPNVDAGEIMVAGTFTIETNIPERVTASTLDFYDLALEYSTGSMPKVVHHVWDKTISVTGKTPIPFALDIQDFVVGSIALSVKGPGNAVLWQKQLDPAKDVIDQVDIRVALIQPNVLNTSPEALSPANKKLRGQVIVTGRQQDLRDLTVLIQAKKEGDLLWKIVSAGETDRSGNFSMPFPFGNFTQAQALISLTPDRPTSISIVDRDNEKISDDFLFLLASEEEFEALEPEEDEEDCDCNTPSTARRLPDQADLIESDEYTQDIGGSCINLTTPNRTLREYNHQAIVRVSDPDVANYTLEKVTGVSGNVSFRLRGEETTIQRKIVNLANPIRWQDAPDAANSFPLNQAANLSLYQAVTVATGHILHYKSVFKADGYSLGDLLYSLPLAPGQKKQIVVFDSSHSLTGAESQTISQGESLSASLTNDRSITDQLSGTIGEALDGRSNANTSGISAGLGLGGAVGPIGGSLGVSGGFSNSNSTASQNSSRDISQFFGERLRQSVMQNAESYRQLNATVVTTVKEGQQYAVITESVANHNHCHSLTMMYFEVLRHYAIYQELANVEECVFVPLLMTNFTIENISKWKDVLAQHLLALPSSTYLQPYNKILYGRQHPLLKAFDANERIKTDYTQVDYPPINTRYCDEVMTSVQGTMTIRTNLKRPKTRYDRIKSLPIVIQKVTSEVLDVEGTIRKNALLAAVPFGFLAFGSATTTVTEEKIVVGQLFDQFMVMDANYATVAPARCIRVKNFQPRSIVLPDGTSTNSGDGFFEDGPNDKRLWTAYANLLDYPGDNAVYNMLDYYFSGRLIAEWDDIFYNDIVPQVFDNIVKGLNFERFTFDKTRLTEYTGGEKSIKVRLRATSTGIIRSDLPESIKIVTNDLVRALNGGSITIIVENVNLNYTTAHFEGSLFNGYVGDDLYDNVSLLIPLTTADKRDPRKEDKFLVRQLIEHLNSNLEHYNKMLWYKLDPDRRFMLLDGFHIQVYDDFANPIDFRSLASVVKNQLVTITGNSMVFPVAAGYKVSNSYISAVPTETDGTTPAQITLLDHYKPLTPIPPYRISVPTRGVFLEAIQGSCDACEKVKANSSQDWNKFTVDEPTPIATVTTPTPTVTDWRAAFKDLAQPLVNIQNAPATPEPGAGLSGLNDLLGKAGVFNDITGLQGNQQNAIRTYLSNQENVRAMAEMAKGLAMQQHNTANTQSITDSIAQARETGAITSEEESSLTRQHLQQQIDGGESTRETARTERERERPSLTEAAIEAAGDGRTITAQRTDTDGNVESVRIGDDSTADEASSVSIDYDVPLIPQPTGNSCWAASMAMIVSYRRNYSISPQAIVEESLSESISLDDSNDWSVLEAVKEHFGFVAIELPSSTSLYLSPEQWHNWLVQFGPLWITTTGTPSHAVVVCGIQGDLTTGNTTLKMNNPSPVGTGRQYNLSFNELAATFGRLSLNDYGNWRVLYLPDTEEREEIEEELDDDSSGMPGSEELELREATRIRFQIPGMGVLSGTPDCDGWEPFGRLQQRAALTKNNHVISEQMFSALQVALARDRLEATLQLFTLSDPIIRAEIDVALVLVIGAREGGPPRLFTNSAGLVISAGRRDTHPEGVSGLDFLYNAVHLFPASIRSQVHLVTSGYRPGREDRRAASLPGKYLLAGVIVWVTYMERLTLSNIRRVFSDRYNTIVSAMTPDAKRAWVSLAFAGTGWVNNTLNYLNSSENASDEGVLNKILTDEGLRAGIRGSAAEAFHLRGAIVSAGRAWMLEQLLAR